MRAILLYSLFLTAKKISYNTKKVLKKSLIPKSKIKKNFNKS